MIRPAHVVVSANLRPSVGDIAGHNNIPIRRCVDVQWIGATRQLVLVGVVVTVFVAIRADRLAIEKLNSLRTM